MADIINFPDRNHPDNNHIFTDDEGATWFEYSASYMDKEKKYSFSLWAKSIDDAQRILKLPIIIEGQIIRQIEG